jgi:phosphate transport system substrate-binding protein
MKMHVHRFLAPLVALVLPVALLLPASAAQTINVGGTTNLAPLVTKAAAAYQSAHPGVTITVKGDSSGEGIAALKAHKVDIAMSDVAVNDTDLTDTVLGVVGFAFVVNPDVGVKNLTRDELTQIFDGKVTNWKAIGGNDHPIVIIGRQIGTGTRFVFEDKVAKTLVPIKVEDNATAVLNAVAAAPGALGYLASGFLDGHQDLAVTYNGVAPTPDNIRNHLYSFATDEHLYTQKNADPAVNAFVQYVKNATELLKANGVF